MAGSNSSDRSRKARSPQKERAGRQGETGGSSRTAGSGRGSSKRASQAAARQLRRDASRVSRASRTGPRPAARRPPPASDARAGGHLAEGLASLTEQLANRILK